MKIYVIESKKQPGHVPRLYHTGPAFDRLQKLPITQFSEMVFIVCKPLLVSFSRDKHMFHCASIFS